MTQTPVRLVPLVCAKCRSAIPAQPDEVAWVCETCGQGLLLDLTPAPGPSECATRPIDVFFSAALASGQPGRPFWVAQGQVVINQRITYKGDEGREAQRFWASPRLFYIPAWEIKLEELIRAGVGLLRSPQRMEAGSRMAFLPVVTPPGDVQALAEFMVFNIEADRQDMLKTVDFKLTLQPPQLWILP